MMIFHSLSTYATTFVDIMDLGVLLYIVIVVNVTQSQS